MLWFCMSRENPNSLDHTIPLFIHDSLLKDGHDVTSTNTTGTFVKYADVIYLLTCNHVIEQVDMDMNQTIMICCDHAMFPFSPLAKDRSTLSIKPVATEHWEGAIDIAISKTDHCWQMISEVKSKRPVDLDNWQEPNWDNIEIANAHGWVNAHKKIIENRVATSGVCVAAEMSTKISPQQPQFTMHSHVENIGYGLSGISGGVITILENDIEIPIGIVFEGHPSALNNNQDIETQSFLGNEDLQVRGHLLTPDIFKDWLHRSGI